MCFHGDDDEFMFNNASTHEGLLHHSSGFYGELEKMISELSPNTPH